MSLWVQLTVNGSPALVNLELATWMEPLDAGSGGGTRIHFNSDQTVTVGESVETIAELLELFDEEEQESDEE